MLVAVGEGMILDDEIEQMGRLFLATSLKGFDEHGLLYVAQQRFQSIAARVAEERRGFSFRGQIAPECVYRGAGCSEIECARGWLPVGWRF